MTTRDEELDAKALRELIVQKRREQGIGDGGAGLPNRAPKPTASEVEASLRQMRTDGPKNAEEWAKVRSAIDRNEKQSWEAALVRDAGESRCRNCRFATFVAADEYQRKVLATVRDYAETLPERMRLSEGLILYGTCGTGKDHLAFAVARMAVWQHGIQARWINAQAWFMLMRDAIKAGASESDLLGDVATSPLLVISDPAPPSGTLTDYQHNLLYSLVDRRAAYGLPSIVTANVRDDQRGKERLGVPTWNRLCARAWRAKMVWPSYRQPRPDKDIME